MDEATLSRIDRMVGSDRKHWASRSGFVRRAAQEFLNRLEREAEEERERRIFRKARLRLDKQAEALVQEQAEL